MQISTSSWVKYVNGLYNIDKAAGDKVGKFVQYFKNIEGVAFDYGNEQHLKKLIDYAYGISTQYGEAAAALACEMYDEVGLASGLFLEPAVPVDMAAYEDVAKAIKGTAKTKNTQIVISSVSRIVKLAGVDTTIKNGLRDGAEFAWIPHGDTCAFCIALASRGWQEASPKLIRNGHAEHVHANCDCTFAIRFNDDTTYEGYDPEKYLSMYYDAPLKEGQRASAKNHINALRRQFYAENKEEINLQKRIAYGKRVEMLNSSAAEEIEV